MNFFRSSFFSDFKLPDVLNQHPSSHSPSSQSPRSEAASQAEDEIGWEKQWSANAEADPAESGNSGCLEVDLSNEGQPQDAWNFGNLVKSLTSKSGEMLQTYRRDLGEFSSGLKKETEVLREVVKDLPNSVEAGASLAQESLETVGQVIEEIGFSVWKGTSEIIAQGKDAMLKIKEDDSSFDAIRSGATRYASTPILGGRYSRFEAQVNAMQHDSSTYCDEPKDEEDYNTWRFIFRLEDKKEDIESLLKENAFVGELQSRIVPSVLDYDTFWTRYYYRLHKLQQAEATRANLVKRATAAEEEDLTWDSDDDIEEEGNGEKEESNGVQDKGEETNLVDKQTEKDTETKDTGTLEDKASLEGTESPTRRHRTVSMVTNVDNLEEEDSGWEVAEDIEDLSGSEEKKSSNSEASWEVPEAARPDIRKRFSAVEDDEDLSWDVDDEDDNAKP